MHLTIQKYDPSLDDEPYYVEGDIEYTENMSALKAVREFHETVEPVIFDMSCCGHSCGRCAVELDGEPILMCDTPITDEDHTIEPLSGFPVIRDLIVDTTTMKTHLTNILNRALIEPVTAVTTDAPNYSIEKNDYMASLEKCIRCGICTSACPVYNEDPTKYAGPTAMMAHAYRCFDGFNSANQLARAVSDGLYRCIQCGVCDNVCPRGIDHLGMYELMRNEAEEAGLKPSYAD